MLYKTSAKLAMAKNVFREPQIHLGDVVVTPKESLKYLCVIIDRKLKIGATDATEIEARVKTESKKLILDSLNC